MNRALLVATAVLVLSQPTQSHARQDDGLQSSTFAGLRLRSIGPAVRSGRIADVVKDPTDRSVWYVAVASGNVWKTVNAGTTWTPIFDNYGSYSTGSLALDPNNSSVVWLGTGENASQRSAGYGDGIYKSLDGGRSWQNMGLATSEHIAKILVDPRNSDVVFAASQGPLWAPGGDRGLFKTTDGGQNWTGVLEVSENTGITDIAFDPRDPDIIYAASYQRRRHVGVLVAGGPESAIYKSTDAGSTWRKVTRGLPTGDVGRIALAVSPQNPDVVYALIAAVGEASGFFRSTDRGESWVKQSDYIVVDPQYYGEIYPDPHQFDRVYAVDVQVQVTHDGGRSFQPIPSRFKHVDNHSILFDPDDPDYLMVGCDGGIYESWDRGQTWKYISNLSITQFYRVGLDNAMPFYNVYGGTQDNATLGGPSRTTTVHGIRNSDWFVTVGGDGFQPRVDPENPNIVYSESQYAGIVRFDRSTGERIDIQPQPGPGEAALRWHWDAPLLISPHSAARIYFAANRLFRSDDRANTWEAISPDLSRGLDRNQRELMGRVWGPDAVWKNVFTSPYGTIVAFDESSLIEGLLYVGTDDGLIQVSEDSGTNWRLVSEFAGVPEFTYVADVLASRHDPNTVFAAFNNHKEGDFKPYLLKSTDRGRTWESIAANLPDRHVTWSIVEDHVNSNLLFAGTEFGLFFTIDGGGRWVQLSGGVPTVAFRDLEIQRRENDLVGATFGRGFYILDDYTPLRYSTPDVLAAEAALFPVKDAWMYIESSPMGGGEKASQGHDFFTAPNPPYGAVFTYHLREGLQSRTLARRQAERQAAAQGQRVSYPSWDSLRVEDRDEGPTIVFTVADQEGNVVRRLTGPTRSGMHRVAWDLRYTALSPTRLGSAASGPMVVPGSYTVSMAKRVDGVLTPLGEAQTFEAKPLGAGTLPAADRRAMLAFQQRVGELQRAVMGANEVVQQSLEQLAFVKQALRDASGSSEPLQQQAQGIERRLLDIQVELNGDQTIRRRAELIPPSIVQRVQRVVRAYIRSTSSATTTHEQNDDIAAAEFEPVLARLVALIDTDLAQLHNAMEAAGMPWTPGRGVPRWRR